MVKLYYRKTDTHSIYARTASHIAISSFPSKPSFSEQTRTDLPRVFGSILRDRERERERDREGERESKRDRDRVRVRKRDREERERESDRQKE